MTFKLTEPMEEAAYIDAVRLVAYDVPPGWSMTVDDRMSILGPAPTGRPVFYRRVARPVAAYNERAEDVLAEQDDGKVGILQRLTDLWASTDGSHLSRKGVASRINQLNDEGWLIGPASSAVAGPKLVKWRRHHKET